MGLVPEAIKDLLGVMDDAKDFTDRLAKIAHNVDPLFRSLEKAGKDLDDDLRKAQAEGDNKKVASIFKSLDIDRSLLIGKTVSQELSSAWSYLDKLTAKLQRLPEGIQRRVRPLIDDARREVKTAVAKHGEIIGALSAIQDERKSANRKLAIAVGTGVTLAGLGVVTSIALGIGLRTALIQGSSAIARGAISTAAGHLTQISRGLKPDDLTVEE